MEAEIKGLWHSLLTFMIVAFIYTTFVKPVLPTQIQGWIGV